MSHASTTLVSLAPVRPLHPNNSTATTGDRRQVSGKTPSGSCQRVDRAKARSPSRQFTLEQRAIRGLAPECQSASSSSLRHPECADAIRRWLGRSQRTGVDEADGRRHHATERTPTDTSSAHERTWLSRLLTRCRTPEFSFPPSADRARTRPPNSLRTSAVIGRAAKIYWTSRSGWPMA
jgi:hypothetical protein